MNKSDVQEMLALIEKDPELKAKFISIIATSIGNDFTIQNKITELVDKDLSRKMRTAGG